MDICIPDPCDAHSEDVCAAGATRSRGYGCCRAFGEISFDPFKYPNTDGNGVTATKRSLSLR